MLLFNLHNWEFFVSKTFSVGKINWLFWSKRGGCFPLTLSKLTWHWPAQTFVGEIGDKILPATRAGRARGRRNHMIPRFSEDSTAASGQGSHLNLLLKRCPEVHLAHVTSATKEKVIELWSS